MSSLGIPPIVTNDWVRLRVIIDKLKHLRLGGGSTPEFEGLILTGLAASRLVWTDSGKELASKDLVDLIAGTVNRVTVADDAAGGVTLSGPQDIHVDATPEFAGITIKDSSGNIVMFSDDTEFYITASVSIPIEAGMPIGLALALTYASP